METSWKYLSCGHLRTKKLSNGLTSKTANDNDNLQIFFFEILEWLIFWLYFQWDFYRIIIRGLNYKILTRLQSNNLSVTVPEGKPE